MTLHPILPLHLPPPLSIWTLCPIIAAALTCTIITIAIITTTTIVVVIITTINRTVLPRVLNSISPHMCHLTNMNNNNSSKNNKSHHQQQPPVQKIFNHHYHNNNNNSPMLSQWPRVSQGQTLLQHAAMTSCRWPLAATTTAATKHLHLGLLTCPPARVP